MESGSARFSKVLLTVDFLTYANPRLVQPGKAKEVYRHEVLSLRQD